MVIISLQCFLLPTSRSQDQMDRRTGYNFVIRSHFVIIHLLSLEYQPLLWLWDTCFLFHTSLIRSILSSVSIYSSTSFPVRVFTLICIFIITLFILSSLVLLVIFLRCSFVEQFLWDFNFKINHTLWLLVLRF